MHVSPAGFTLVGDTFTMEETCTKYNIYKYLLAKNYIQSSGYVNRHLMYASGFTNTDM